MGKRIQFIWELNLFANKKNFDYTIMANNRYMLELFDGVWNRGSSFRIFSAIEDIDMAQSLGDHDELIDAIASGNPDQAAAAMRAHISDGLQLQMKSL